MKAAHKISHSHVQQYRERMLARGFRQIQLWVPNTKAAQFAKECRRQSLLASKQKIHDPELTQFLEQTAKDIEGWKA